jgi:8-oxo-dGTP pyrophosphatase MutT (NUDIX family)
VALSCRPENEATVREYMEEAGVDLQVILDRNDPDLFTELTEGDIRWSYPEVARERTRRVSRERAEKAKAKAEMADSLRIILHHLERPQTVRVKTGPTGTEIHLGE